MPDSDAVRGFERRLLSALPDLAAPEGRPRVLVAVSGGADSTALLVALSALVADGRLGASLIACHVDHGLRPGATRQAEQALLAANCRALGVPLLLRSVQVERSTANVRGSLEAAARQARYVALAEAAGEAGAAAVLTAHTAGDQAETVLLRLLRGTGLTGLAAIRPVSRYWGVHGPLLVRPLLDVWPEETRRYCRERGVAWSEDETNASARFVRNRVRHELLPLLRTLHPGADRSIVRLAARARALDDWLDGEVGRARATLWLQEGSGYLLRRPRTELAPFLGKEVVARVLAELLGGAGAPGERQVEAVFACWRGSLGRRLDLGQGWQVEAVREGLRFRQGLPPHPSLSAGCAECWRLRFGETDLPGWRVVVTAGSASPSNATDPFTAYVAAEEPARLAVRFWRPGDRLKPAGLGGSKKLQDIFVDEKVERSRRDGVPLLFLDGEAGTEGECVWAVGVKRSRLAPATAGRGRALRVAFTRRPGD